MGMDGAILTVCTSMYKNTLTTLAAAKRIDGMSRIVKQSGRYDCIHFDKQRSSGPGVLRFFAAYTGARGKKANVELQYAADNIA